MISASVQDVVRAHDAPAWFPNWRGEYCAIIASGPSVKRAEVDMLKGRLKIIAIKESGVELAPWADVLYGCDFPWWRHRRGAPEFKGLKVAWDDRASRDYPDVRCVRIKDKMLDRLALDDAGVVGSGGNSGFQALNLAVQFGVKGLLLVGFDMNDQSLQHWYGRNNWPKANNPDHSNFERWRRAFTAASAQLAALSIDVVNCSPVSSLKCFRRATIGQTLSGWGI